SFCTPLRTGWTRYCSNILMMKNGRSALTAFFFLYTIFISVSIANTTFMSDLRKIKRALISVSDKSGVLDLARGLASHGVTIISTGGTASALREAGIEVTEVSEITGFPEMMDGRVKTLHPMVHGAFLALRDNDEHLASMKQHGIEPIDLVVVNLYPFESTIAKEGV